MQVRPIDASYENAPMLLLRQTIHESMVWIFTTALGH
jgi:hypothetical protein